jgi:hypothetical protein
LTGGNTTNAIHTMSVATRVGRERWPRICVAPNGSRMRQLT